MFRFFNKWIVTFGLLLFFLAPEACWSLTTIPAFKQRVTDLTGTLAINQKTQIEQQLSRLEIEKGSQLAVLIVNSTLPESIEQYAIRVVDEWQLGRKNIDDGVLFLIAKDDRKLRIEVGYGLEGSIPDAIAKRVIAETITPYFKQGQFNKGISAGVNQLVSLVEGEALPPPLDNPGYGSETSLADLPFLLIFLLFFSPATRSLFGRLIGASVLGTIAGFIAWSVSTILTGSIFAGIVVFLLALFMNSGGRSNFPRSRGGGYGGGFGGGGWSGGSGGGFGGGGGGGFGGGGASGGW